MMVIQVHVNHLFILEIKYMIQANVRRGTIRRENVCLGICPFGKLSCGELSVGELSSGNCPSGNVRRGTVLEPSGSWRYSL